jgi:putative flippase GtrA
LIGILIAILIAALVYWLCVVLLGLPAIVGIVAAILVLIAGFPASGGYGFRNRRPRA